MDHSMLSHVTQNSLFHAGGNEQFLVVSETAALVSFDSKNERMDIHRVSLPGIRQAVPLYISEGSRR